jgi:hypothetical protein
MLAMLALGIGIGSVLTPTAHAQTLKPTPIALDNSIAPSGGISVAPWGGCNHTIPQWGGDLHNSPYSSSSGAAPFYPYYPMYEWQIYPMQAPNSPPMLFLLDASSGSSFYLRTDRATNSFFWAAIPRG